MPIPLGHAYVVNNSYLFNIAFQIAKPFLNDEYISKLHIINDDYSELLTNLGPEALEKKFGGNLKSNAPYGKQFYSLVLKYRNFFESEYRVK